MHEIHMFGRKGGAHQGKEVKIREPTGWTASSLISRTGKTIVVSPYKVYGPETNDLGLRLRKRGKSKVILAGMSANLCVESHLRELLERGFEVTVVSDGTTIARHPELGDGYQAALTNFRLMARAVLPTEEVTRQITER